METLDDILIHFGVKGMKWGVRKNREHGHKQPGYKVYDDGRIEIEPGVKMQRLVTSSKLKDQISRPLNGYSYMSFLPTDNAQYIHKMAPKTKASGSDLKRDTVLTLRTKQNLKSPSLEEAQKVNVEVVKKYTEEFKAYSKSTNPNKKFDDYVSKEGKSYFHMMETEFQELPYYVKNKAMTKEFETMKKQDAASLYSDLLYRPEKYPAYLYAIANRHIANDDPDVAPFKNRLLKAIENKGYNMLRDETDVRTGLWSSPVIVLNPEKNVEITVSKKISRMKLWQARRYVERGKSELKSLGL